MAHWKFCYEYYHTARIIKYVHEDIPVPKEINKCDRIQYWTWIILSIVSSIVFEVFVRIEYWKELQTTYVEPSFISTVAFVSSIPIGITFITAIYFAYAIFKIRKMILKFNEKNSIDTKILIVHITSLALLVSA